MKNYRARVEITGGPAVDDVRVILSEQDPPLGLRSWEGRCVLPYVAGELAPQELRLTLDDGRSGVALVRHAQLSTSDAGWLIDFDGNGPLE